MSEFNDGGDSYIGDDVKIMEENSKLIPDEDESLSERETSYGKQFLDISSKLTLNTLWMYNRVIMEPIVMYKWKRY